MKLNSQRRVPPLKRLRATSSNGFTLLEVMVALVIIGILFAIAAPSWDALLNRLRLSTAQDEILQAMRTAQSKARLSRVNWQASFREDNGIVQWVVHPAGITPDESLWNSLDKKVQLDETGKETTLPKADDGIRRVQFNHLGRTGNIGSLTLKAKAGGQTRRCVYVSTLLGALRKGEDHSKKHNDKFCY